MSVVLTVKVIGHIRPPLAQMASTKACYKLGLSGVQCTKTTIRMTCILSYYFAFHLYNMYRGMVSTSPLSREWDVMDENVH